MSRSAHSSSKRSGSTIEDLVINRHQLQFVPDRDASWHDAVTTASITTSEAVPITDVCVIAPETPVEIKGAQGLRSNGDRQTAGHFFVHRRSHERLVDADGVYWLVVYKPRGSSTDVCGQVVVPADRVDDLLEDRWYQAPPHRSEGEVAQLSWPHVLDREEVLDA